MARRDWGVIKGAAGDPGDQDAVAAAMALAYRFDADVIRSVGDVLTSIDRLGGQLAVQVQRVKVDGDGDPVEDQRNDAGVWVTYGFIFSHESRDQTVKPINPPEPDLDKVDFHQDGPVFDEPVEETPGLAEG